MWNFRRTKNKIVVTKHNIPVVDIPLETKVVEAEVRKIKIKPYIEPTDKEMIEGLEESEHYDEAYRIRDLKKEVANLKRKLTILQKKYDGVIKP